MSSTAEITRTEWARFHRSVVLPTQGAEDVGRFLRFVLLFAVVMIQAFSFWRLCGQHYRT
jgi:hypothetical protein